MITFHVEQFADSYEEALPLIAHNWAELSDNPDIPLDLNTDAYRQSEQVGLLRVYVARDEFKKMVGYSIMLVSAGLHFKQIKQATQDVVYTDPDRRNERWGVNFLTFITMQLEAEGVDIIYQNAKLKHPALGRVLTALGYEPVETIYQKRCAKWV